MLGARKPDALGPHAACPRGVLGGVGVGTDEESAFAIGDAHETVNACDELCLCFVEPLEARGITVVEACTRLEIGGDGTRLHGDLSEEYFTACAINRHEIPVAQHHFTIDAYFAGGLIDRERLDTAHARAAEAAGDDGRVGGLAAACREHAFGGDHAREIIGVGFAAHEDRPRALFSAREHVRGGKGDVTGSGPRGGIHAACEEYALGLRIEGGEHEARELVAGHAHERLVFGDRSLVEEGGGNAERGSGGALTHAGLKHPEPARFDRELDIAQVAIVPLELFHDAHELAIVLGKQALHIGKAQRVPNARNDVLALSVEEEVAIHAACARRGVARESNTGCALIIEVPENHRTHVDGGAEVVGDALGVAVHDRARRIPRVEHRVDTHGELRERVLRERRAGFPLDDLFETRDDPLEVTFRKLDIARGSRGLLRVVENRLE